MVNACQRLVDDQPSIDFVREGVSAEAVVDRVVCEFDWTGKLKIIILHRDDRFLTPSLDIGEVGSGLRGA
jgi:hypothetical protein